MKYKENETWFYRLVAAILTVVTLGVGLPITCMMFAQAAQIDQRNEIIRLLNRKK